MVVVLFYRIVPNLDEDDSPNSKSDASDDNEVNDMKSLQMSSATSIQSSKFIQIAATKTLASLKCIPSNPEDDEIGDGLRTTTALADSSDTGSEISQQQIGDDQTQAPFIPGKVERRRRKLPEIPKNKRCKRMRCKCILSPISL